MLTVRREDFMPAAYRDHSYHEVPVPLLGRQATISCPHSYPLFYEALGLEEGQRFLEVGLGSGYSAALAREVVGPRGLVVSLEIDPDTFAYAASSRRAPDPAPWSSRSEPAGQGSTSPPPTTSSSTTAGGTRP
jgi:protein-L-isoaspartate(D-aspartate) O-methyltransferase